MTAQQGDNDRLTLRAQQAAEAVAKSNIAVQQPQIKVLEQDKAYQRVVGPFDGVTTQRNIDDGSLVQAGSTFMFTLMHADVIRTQVFVPQDEALGVQPVSMQSSGSRSFPGERFQERSRRSPPRCSPAVARC
ncbi:efflux RND transporter periplasmic adaptor subunit [Bradyrhizobium sp. 48]|uniref:efflux RND transporter periplasmic adaptor subunit n=1 Tax=Bradyrhizobium sp. 48 TaxID=2782676 RepID=UPI001FF879E5|nr:MULTISPECIES: efflux RND transporter periplasmic adaptor subunit [unclassified Bradyrhizobium]